MLDRQKLVFDAQEQPSRCDFAKPSNCWFLLIEQENGWGTWIPSQ